MDSCLADVVIEFLAVAFHNILYYTSVYPMSIFETRRKYNLVVYYCNHPEVNQYINLCLKSLTECLKNGQLTRVEFSVTDDKHNPLMNFVFDFNTNKHFEETSDAYLIQTEQNLRAFCLNLSSNTTKFKMLECSSFTVQIHTNESAAIGLVTNPDLEDFPLIEVDGPRNNLDKILPLRRMPIRNYFIDSFIELR